MMDEQQTNEFLLSDLVRNTKNIENPMKENTDRNEQRNTQNENHINSTNDLAPEIIDQQNKRKKNTTKKIVSNENDETEKYDKKLKLNNMTNVKKSNSVYQQPKKEEYEKEKEEKVEVEKENKNSEKVDTQIRNQKGNNMKNEKRKKNSPSSKVGRISKNRINENVDSSRVLSKVEENMDELAFDVTPILEQKKTKHDNLDIISKKDNIKKYLLNKLTIAMDVNMSFSKSDRYYMNFTEDLVFRKFIFFTLEFTIIVGKSMKLSVPIIIGAMIFVHKYFQKFPYEQSLSKAYFIVAAAIFLSWKIREDCESVVRSFKLHDIPMQIYRLVNLMRKTKRMKRVKKKWELILYKESHKQIIKKGEEEKEKEKNDKMQKLLNAACKSIEEEMKKEQEPDIRNIKDIIDECKDLMNSILYSLKSDNEINKNKNDVNKRNRKDRGEEKEQTEETANYKGIEETTWEKKETENNWIYQLKTFYKEKNKDLYISCSKWIIDSKSQELLNMQELIIYYEQKILKSIDFYFKLNVDILEILPSTVHMFIHYIEIYVSNKKVLQHLDKMCLLVIMDLYKTPLCLIYTPKEILIVCLLKAFFKLCVIYDMFNSCISNIEAFEEKMKLFVEKIFTDTPLSLDRIKVALQELRSILRY